MHYSLGKKGSHPGGTARDPASDLRGQVLWRRERSIYRTEIEGEGGEGEVEGVGGVGAGVGESE